MARIGKPVQTAQAGGRSAGFLGVERLPPHEAPSGSIAVLGIPGATPYASSGAYCAAAPAAIRSAISSYSANATHYDFDLGGPLLPTDVPVVDCGDLAFDPAEFAANRDRIRHTISALLDRGVAPIVLGGDDSVQIPVVEAHAARGQLTILQIDAHIDWRDEVEGEKHGLSSTMRRVGELAGVTTMVQVGARAVGSARPADVDDARRRGVDLFDMRRVRREGVGAVIGAIPNGVAVVVCLDVDGLDPSVVPAVFSRAPGGLAYGDIVELLAGVGARAPVVGFNVVELVPGNDIDGQGTLVAARLALLGIGAAARSRQRR